MNWEGKAGVRFALPTKRVEDMTREEMLELFTQIRDAMLTCEDGGEFLIWLGMCLSVELK